MLKTKIFTISSFCLVLFLAVLSFLTSPVKAAINRWNPEWNGVGYNTYTYPPGGTITTACQVIQQTDGKLLQIGTVPVIGTNGDVAIWRYNSDGTLDDTFGDGSCVNGVGTGGTKGCVIKKGIAPTDTRENGYSILVDKNGRYLIAGQYLNSSGFYPSTYIARLNSDFSFDTSFNGTGVYRFQALGDWVTSECAIKVTFLDKDESKILLTGYYNNAVDLDAAIWVFNSTNGTLDTGAGGFNSGLGYVYYDSGLHDLFANVQILSDDSLLLIGRRLMKSNPYTTYLTLWKYGADGKLDSNFGDGSCINGVGSGGTKGCTIFNPSPTVSRSGQSIIVEEDHLLVLTSANLYKFTLGGQFISNFGSLPTGGNSLLKTYDNKYVLAGGYQNNLFLFVTVRFSPDNFKTATLIFSFSELFRY